MVLAAFGHRTTELTMMFWCLALPLVIGEQMLWLDAASGHAKVTFSANGAPGAHPPATKLFAQRVNSTRKQLHLESSNDNEFVANIPVQVPFLLEAGANSSAGRVQYYASADRVTTPNDWFAIQDSATNAFEVTLRDPYMHLEDMSLLGDQRPSCDQCPPGAAWYQGDACLIAVVRFNQSLFGCPVNLTTFALGKTLRTAILPAAALGVVIIRVPNASVSNTTYASVSYTEEKSGVTHIATTSTLLQR